MLILYITGGAFLVGGVLILADRMISSKNPKRY